MIRQPRFRYLLSSLLVGSTLALGACQTEVGVGGDPDTAVQGNASPAASPEAKDPSGRVVAEGLKVKDLAAVGGTLAALTEDSLVVGSKEDFSPAKETNLQLASTCTTPGDLVSGPQSFLLACGDKVLRIDPANPKSVEEIPMEEDSPVTTAAESSSGEIFAASRQSQMVGVYRQGKREGEIKAEAGSDQILTVPNGPEPDGVVRTLREDSTIQSLDWANSRAGGRLRVGQGVGQIASGDNGVVVASDTSGGRLAIYTAQDVVRLHQYGPTDGSPWGVAWDDSRNLAWVTNTDLNSAQGFDIAAGVPKEKAKIATVANAQHVAVLDDGTVALASATGDGVQFVSDPSPAPADSAH